MNKLAASIIIPTYNSSTYIKPCLESVINQDEKNIEILIIDDGSTDDTVAILNEYASKDVRIRIFRQEHQNAGAARNLGIRNAQGEYFFFLDADDFFEDNLVSSAVKRCRETHADLCVYKIKQYYNDTKKFESANFDFVEKNFPPKKVFTASDMPENIFNSFMNWAWNKCFSADFIKKYNIRFQEISKTNDFYFVAVCLLNAKITVLRKELVYYRKNTGVSTQDTNDRAPCDFLKAFDAVQEYMVKNNIYEMYKKSFIRHKVGGIVYNLLSLKTLQAFITLFYNIKSMHNHCEFIKNTNIFNILNNGERYFDIFLLNVDQFIKKYKLSLSTVKNLEDTEMVKVSVLVPTLNVRPYIEECIDSIINQTLKEIEIICIDAGSTDGTLEVLQHYTQKDARVRLLQSDKKSYGYQMNLGLDAAKGEYIGIVESDDYIREDMYEHQYALAKSADLDFIKADFKVFYGDKDDRRFVPRKMSRNYGLYNKILSYTNDAKIFNIDVVIWTGIYKSSFIKSNNIRFNETPGASYQDNGFNFQATALAKKVWLMDDDFYRLRRDNPNSSVFSKKKVYALCEEYDFIKQFINEKFPHDVQLYRIHCVKRFHNYMWNLDRIAEEFKKEFLVRFAEDFRADFQAGHICEPYFTANEIKKLTAILEKEDHAFSDYDAERREKYKQELLQWYRRATGRILDLDNPKTFNEKIQWLKLYDSTPIKTRLADKYLVREWVAEKIGEKYLVPLLGVYDNFDQIDFDSLPQRFVIKCNHGSGWNVIVKNKALLDLREAKRKIDYWMASDFSVQAGYELHYRDIPRKIIIEKFIDDIGESVYDYRFICSNGKILQIWIDIASGTPDHKRTVYDADWNELDVRITWPKLDTPMRRPDNFSELKRLAEVLSMDFNQVRVDFYNVNGKIYFGEMTFSSLSGIGKFIPEKSGKMLGKQIPLPEKAYNVDTKQYYTLEKEKGLIRKFKFDNEKLILIGDIPLYHRIKRNGKKKISLCGLQLYKKTRTDSKKKLSLLGIPVYSVKREGFRTTRRILFIRYSWTDKIRLLQENINVLRAENRSFYDSILKNMNTLQAENRSFYDSILKNMNIMSGSGILSAQRSASEAVWGISFHDVSAGSLWLKNKSFAVGRWALGYPALYALYRILNEAKPRHILELGLGTSTKMIGQYVAAFDEVEHTAVEHDLEWISFFRQDFELTERSHLIQLDREMSPYKDAEAVRTFSGFADAFAGQKFDFICIDAPLGDDMKQYARVDVLRLLPDCLEEDFIIMLDDTNRPGETHTLEEMSAVLQKAGIEHYVGHYSGNKKTSVICSVSRKFFASM